MTGTIQAASLGIPDTLFIMVLALVVFGPRRLPEIGRQLGKLMYEFRKASNEFKFQMDEEMRSAEEADRRAKLDAENRQLYPALNVIVPASEQLPAVVGETPSGEANTSAEANAGSEVNTYTADANLSDSSAPSSVLVPVNDTPVEQPSGLRIQPPSTGEPVLANKPAAAIAATLPTDEKQTESLSV